MQSRLLTALLILLALSGCIEEIHAQDQPATLPGEIQANEATEPPSRDGEADATDIELRNPVTLD